MIATPPLISIIIPVLHDAPMLRGLLETLPPHSSAEIIVVDGSTLDRDMRSLELRFTSCRWLRSRPGRAAQMNAGARAALGRWLLFLHADTRLPIAWADEVCKAEVSPDIVGGSFRFALDADDWPARLIEWGVALRVRWLRLPYGDQALFVRRDVFESLGGYAELPLMEDVDLVRRLGRKGRLWFSRVPAVTSASRWRQNGWFRHSRRNLWLAAQYFAGVPVSKLAMKYYGNAAVASHAKRAAVALMARAPSDPNGKTRLVAGLSAASAASLRRALLLDTLSGVAEAGDGLETVILLTPPDARAEFEALAPGLRLLAQRGGDLGERMHHGFVDLFLLGFEPVTIVGSDLPGLPPEYLDQAVAAIRQNAADVVLGPAADGGYYLIALARPCEDLFQGINWSRSSVLRQTVTQAERLGMRAHLLPALRDVDSVDDLKAVVSDSMSVGSRAQLVREWLAAGDKS